MPLGHGLAFSQLSASFSQVTPQKNLVSVSSTAPSGTVVLELPFTDSSEDKGLDSVGFSSAISSSDLHGVPLKHSCFSGQSRDKKTMSMNLHTPLLGTIKTHLYYRLMDKIGHFHNRYSPRSRNKSTIFSLSQDALLNQ